MNKSVQSLDSIAPMRDGKNTEAMADPVQADLHKGKAHLQNNELSQAAAAFHNALLGYQERGDEQGVANASNQMGHVCLARKDYDQALGHYTRAWEICEKHGDPMSLLALSNQLVLVYRGQGDFKKAIDTCLDLLDRYFENNDPLGTVAILEQMADIYLVAGDKLKAADSYRTIASIHSNFKHKTIAQSFLEKARDLERAC